MRDNRQPFDLGRDRRSPCNRERGRVLLSIHQNDPSTQDRAHSTWKQTSRADRKAARTEGVDKVAAARRTHRCARRVLTRTGERYHSKLAMRKHTLHVIRAERKTSPELPPRFFSATPKTWTSNY